IELGSSGLVDIMPDRTGEFALQSNGLRSHSRGDAKNGADFMPSQEILNMNLCLKTSPLTLNSQVFPLALGATTIGRAPDSTICLSSDNGVARNHCRVLVKKDEVLLIDLGHAALGLTEVNGSLPIMPVILRVGDLIRIGSTKLILCQSDD
ncbi:MAG: FHA domain-containing protein, partial [Candidatus Hydrogenedentes bacterium]|nr:FHA domain-containing protein [Candidatus Hydrogenedentota bacterium]